MKPNQHVQHVYHHNVASEARVNVKLEKNTKGFNFEITVTGAANADEALAIIKDAEIKMTAAYGQTV
jgi:hypothetical protein